ncbi:MAG: sulfite exporter TauE/SafE family protein [Bacteroidetes bacterium]|nr:MAG: sulfite exporter TauE/SafE family protein [Bacteroidota bacterium]TAG87439.1 MAG: sulfite exporter TauE/SafE family protein [Bacteroidota bacterium]
MIYLFIFLISILIGFINTLAGSGSLVMLPILMNMGLSANVANGTNRIAIFFQSLTGMIIFLKEKKLDWKKNLLPLIFPAILGGLIGAYFSTQMKADDLKSFIVVLMFIMLGVVILKPEKWLKTKENETLRLYHFSTWLLMFLAGFYGGFIQASVGVVLLSILVLQIRYDLTEANGLKVLVIGAYALPVLCVFIWQGQVNWFWGIFTAVGQSIGAYIGAKFASNSPKAKIYTYYLLILVILVSIIQFLST